MAKVVYEFERLGSDWERPPLAALRAFEVAGVHVSREGWLSLPADVRRAVAQLGAEPTIAPAQVRQLLSPVSPREIALRQPRTEPDAAFPPEAVVAVVRLTGQDAAKLWQGLGPLDRHVLGKLVHNTRLLLQAITEIAVRTRQWEYAVSPKQWSGLVAHCEVRFPPELAARLRAPDVLDGQALVLARVAGVRAARAAGDLLDVHRQVQTGPIEIGFAFEHEPAVTKVLWQAHVSTAEGSFYPAASLLAATTAATALADVVGSVLGASARLEAGHLANEPWRVGWEDGDATVAAR